MVPRMVSFPTVGALVCHFLLRLVFVEALLSQVFPAAIVLVVVKLLAAEAMEWFRRVMP